MEIAEALELFKTRGVEGLHEIPRAEAEELARRLFATREALQQENQILFYSPVSPTALKAHLSTAREVVLVGGNRSSKSTTMLADMVIQMTGEVPLSMENIYPKQKLRCPMRVRLTCESLTNTWEPVIKPKLQYWVWNGNKERGHWGLIPKKFLKGGKWETSWSAQYRTLSLTCGCTMQVMSYDQEVENFSGSSIHLALHDEGPPHAIYRENRMRTMDVQGQCYIAMTPPDEETAAWDAAWVFDELYSLGLEGPAKDNEIDAFTLFTEDNRTLNQEDIQQIAKGLTPKQQEVRLRGQFLHLGGRIFPTYTDVPRWWCFDCKDIALVGGERCAACNNTNVVQFSHFVEPFEIPAGWPVINVIDPHDRKPHAVSWFAVSPGDDIYQVAELEAEDEPKALKVKIYDVEREKHLQVVRRLMDPNKGESPSGTTRRGVRVRDEFDSAGLRCDMADDNRSVARQRLKERLMPDPRTKRPGFFVFNTCKRTNFQMMRYAWDEWSRFSADQRSPKAKPKELHDDFPACIQYLVNSNPTYAGLKIGLQPTHRGGKRGRGGY